MSTQTDAPAVWEAPKNVPDLWLVRRDRQCLEPKEHPSYVVDRTLEAIVVRNDPPEVFVRGGKLARIVTDENQHPRIEAIDDDPTMRVVVCEFVEYVRTTKPKGGDSVVAKPIWPPREILQSLRARGSWPGLPALESIVEIPTRRRDGTILDSWGYDVTSRLFYAPAADLAVPRVREQPTPDELAAAVALLRSDLLGDFPFATPADEANALALLLTPIIRPSVPRVPLAVADAPRAGSGKGLLVECAAVIATGRAAAVITAPTIDEEWAKVILSILAAGSTFVFFDEVKELRAPPLAAALTAESFEGRRLGQTEQIRVPQRATWVAAGNNIALGGDLPRRCYRIRLDPKVARPWTRNGWRHPDLLGWVAQHRGELLAALLTIARAWDAAGCPATRVPTLGGFSEWAKTVGGILAHAGVEGFLGNLGELYDQADDDANQWETFLTTLRDGTGGDSFTTGRAATLAQSSGPLRDALPDELVAKLSTPGFRAALGIALRAKVDTRHGEQGLHIIRAGTDSHAKAPLWRLVTDEVAGGHG